MTGSSAVGELREAMRSTGKAVILRMRRRRATRRFVRAVRSAHAPICVNVGAGALPVEGWINADVHWRTAHYLNGTEPWPTGEASIDMILADNVIEHLTLDEGRRFLVHAYDALKPGGVMRIASPDAQRVARAYLEGGELPDTLAHGPVVYAVDLLRNAFVRHEHWRGYVYDCHALTTEMEAVGFEVVECRPGSSGHPGLAREQRVGTVEASHQMVLEGVKPLRR